MYICTCILSDYAKPELIWSKSDIKPKSTQIPLLQVLQALQLFLQDLMSSVYYSQTWSFNYNFQLRLHCIVSTVFQINC